MSDLFTTVEAQASYGIGLQMGEQLKGNPFDGLDIAAVAAGLADAFDGVEPQVSNTTLRTAFGEIQTRMQAAKEQAAQAVIQEGEVFLKENATKAGVQVTASGLQYEVIAAGNGVTPSADSLVRTHYHGTFINGNVFDSSYDRGQPAEFPVGGVIKGWTEALQMMQEGAKWRIYLPYHLAYGEQGAGSAIPPYSTLVFDIELLDVLS